MPSSSMTLSIPPDPGTDTATRSCAIATANITTIAEKSEEVTTEAEDVFTPKLKQPMIAPVAAAVSAAKRKHSSTSSVDKPGTFKAPYWNDIY